ncbi:hypothetical protein CBW65_22540 [Tumebacillus avium]|uniref:MvaI/BcnI restriction endonuclease domain-containing protein n=1 Tax=Tumebacillus avium TaxID=1903704 RepID=A0A1Y0IUJ6_9BACL|nr:MvaI/BcnI family restriction endonuclease [Tumebacillus avium]ARU63466.1 hypothetical protein CBW65_22540 [Tumebacillus avium]
MQLFKKPEKIDDVFCKVLTRNDDSGRHGVLIPVHAYRLFPTFKNFIPDTPENYEEDIITYWEESRGWAQKKSKWKHYHRYPERRMTSLSPENLNNKIEGSLIVVGKYRDNYEYECFVVSPDDPLYLEVGTLFNLGEEGGQFVGSSIIPIAAFEGDNDEDEVIDELVEKIKQIRSLGFVKSLKSGDTGVGFTFEALLGIAANSDKAPDYKGIEIKTTRSAQSKETRKALTGKQTLFSLIPQWGIAGSRKGLVEEFGYCDKIRGRTALYCTIKVVPNSLGWSLDVSEKDGLIYVLRDGVNVVHYSMIDLQNSLESKHKESVFVTAQARKNKDGSEEFLYDSVLHCKEVSFVEFITMIKENLVGVDFAIHSSDGKVRDHGFLWRLENKKYVPRLFKYVQERL